MGKKKKILILNYEFPPLGGGAANANYYLLKEFSKYKDIEIDLVTSSIDEEKTEKFSENITIYYLNIGKKGNLHFQSNKNLLIYSKKALSFSKKLKKEKNYDLCHAFFGIPCGYIAMKLKIPYIVSLRGSDVPFYNKRFYILDKLVFKNLSKKIWKNAKEVVANSEGLKDLALETYDKKEIKVIPNGIDIEEFKPKREERKGKEEKGKIKIVSTGRLIERKGFDFLIKALKGKKNFELTLVGDGPLLEELENLSKEKSVKTNFLGMIDHKDIPEVLQKNDIFVLPSLNEGMSNAILEAMACGLPIISTDTGGSKELVKENGFLVEKENSENLRKILEKFEKNKKLISKKGDISRKMAEEMKWENIAREYYKAYG